MTQIEYIPGAEAARRLNIDRSTLSRWVRDGRIAASHKLPGTRGARLFDAAEVERVRTAAR